MRDWMIKARESKQMTLAQAAEHIGISESYYLLIEQGKRQKELDLTTAIKLGELYGLTVEQIIGKEIQWKESQ